MKRELLRMEHCSVIYNGYEVLKDIWIEFLQGESYGLVCDNMTEESHLLELLKGTMNLADGRIYHQGKKVSPGAAMRVLKENIFLVKPSGRVSAELKVKDAFFILAGRQKKVLKREKQLIARTEAILEAFSLELAADRGLADLTIPEKIQLEMLRAYQQEYRILVLHNLSSSLTGKEMEAVMKLGAELKKRGLALCFIEHDEAVLFRYMDEIRMISKGRTVYCLNKEEFRHEKLENVLQDRHKRGKVQEQKNENGSVFEMRNICFEKMGPLNLRLYPGEIVTLFDSNGLWQRDLIRLMKGELRGYQGTAYLKGQSFLMKGQEELKHRGICVIDENPSLKKHTLFYNLTALENLTLHLSEKNGTKVVNRKQKESIIRESAEFFTRAQLLTKVSELDPYLRQKLVYYKWYLYYPHLIVCVRPVTGVDYRMQIITEAMIKKCSERGIAVLIITASIAEANIFGGKILVLGRV